MTKTGEKTTTLHPWIITRNEWLTEDRTFGISNQTSWTLDLQAGMSNHLGYDRITASFVNFLVVHSRSQCSHLPATLRKYNKILSTSITEKKFKNPIYLGDPINTAKIFNESFFFYGQFFSHSMTINYTHNDMIVSSSHVSSLSSMWSFTFFQCFDRLFKHLHIQCKANRLNLTTLFVT